MRFSMIENKLFKWLRTPALPEDNRPSKRLFLTGMILPGGGVRVARFYYPGQIKGRPLNVTMNKKINGHKWQIHAQL